MNRYSAVIITALVILCCPARAQAQEDIQKMSNEELAEYFMVKECSATLYLVCTDRAKVRERYNTPEVRRSAATINRKLDQRLYQEEIDYAVNTLGLDANEALHGHMVKECGWFSCSWVYRIQEYKRK
jgi:hypothetical protein